MRLNLIFCGLLFLYICGVVPADEVEYLPQSIPCYALESNLRGLTEVDCKTSTTNYDLQNPDYSVFFFQKIPVNRASLELLQTVPGIGPRLAEDIIEYRRIHGPITGFESIKMLPGVGEKRARYLVTQLLFN